ncbi:unnamed protein product [Phaedon cochleariae]|uniref:BPL/LPL catalytic domain-containing protein n=1 Tax=Phaedon cochleariae TaxID=80249 RepID=A0A9P0DGV6_PHACE|nr:unnamed protein product [Phaedon cochleariae]
MVQCFMFIILQPMSIINLSQRRIKMALAQRAYMRVVSVVSNMNLRNYSAAKSTVNEGNIKKSVFISQSKDIFTNLALEDWIYRNMDFKNHHILMLWQSNPCVVIGRHQNPWLEAHLAELSSITEHGVQLARRNSGGGTVYHDYGNLNLTFFTPREHYDRKYNLELITRSLFREYGMNVNISPREDLTIRDYKVSGTASKLGRLSAYHHCTLLVNANKVDLSLALQKQEVEIITNATKSIRSKIMNLCEENPDVTVDNLMTVVGWEYMRTPALTLTDGGIELANQQNGFQLVNPTEEWFNGLTEIRETFESWDWCFGKTPKFNISKSFQVPASLANCEETSDSLKVTMVVENGKVSDVNLYIPPNLAFAGFSGNANVITSVIGQRFSEDALNSMEALLDELMSDKDRFVTECLKQVMRSV